MPATLTTDLIVPEVIADLVETRLGDRVTLLPLAVQDNTLVGQPGDTLKFPAFRYIGKASEIAENGEITPTALTSFAVPATVKKYAKAVQITDEARLSGYGDPVGEAANQLAHAIDHAVDDALFTALNGLPIHRIAPITALSADNVADALTLFGEELEEPAILLVDPAGFAALRKDDDYIRASDLGQRMIFSGVVGEIWGCQIVVSNKIKADTTLQEKRYFIVKPGALRLVNKQGTFLEVQREPKYMRYNIFASKHCAAYLYDDSKIIAASVFSGVQALNAGGATQIRSMYGNTSGSTFLIIPDFFLAPAAMGFKWVYKLDTSASSTATFGTALTGTTDWPGNTTEIAGGSNTYGHLFLVDSANKPYKKADFALYKKA